MKKQHVAELLNHIEAANKLDVGDWTNVAEKIADMGYDPRPYMQALSGKGE